MTSLQDTLEHRFGESFSFQDLEEPIRDLYELGIVAAGNALNSALLKTDSGLAKYPFVVGYPVKNTFNAGTCDVVNGGSVVAINSVVPYLIFFACFAYSTRVDTRTALPKEENEKISVFDKKIKLPGRLGNMPHSAARVFSMFEKIIENPNYKDANLPYALFTYELAMRYIVMHEVMHIILGHTGYVKRVLDLDVFLEFSNNREGMLDHYFSHCLEFLSDRNAARGIASRMLQGDYESEARNLLLDNTKIPINSYLSRCLVTALNIVFHLFPRRDESLEKPIYTHPHPYIRMQWITMELGHEIGKEIDFRESILVPLAYSSAALEANFETPNNWRYATEKDVDQNNEDRPKFTDESYKLILQESEKLGTKLWQEYSPIYKGDGRDAST